MRRIVAVLILIILSGCIVSKNTYVPPEKSLKEVAILKNTWLRTGMFEWEGYYVYSINDKVIDYGMWWGPKDATHKIMTGTNKISVYSEFNRTTGGPCPCTGFANMQLDVQAGKTYQLVGKISGVEIFFSIIDEQTGEPISKMVAAKFAPKPNDVYMPIFIPVR